MSIALLLIPLALVLLGAAVIAFFWAVDHGQFDDLDHVAEHALDDVPPDPVHARTSQAAATPTPSSNPSVTAAVKPG